MAILDTSWIYVLKLRTYKKKCFIRNVLLSMLNMEQYENVKITIFCYNNSRLCHLPTNK